MRLDLDKLNIGHLMADGGKLLIVAALQAMPYPEYLQTNHWQEVRTECMRAAGWRCQWCGKRAHDVHHLCYDNIGCELPEDVLALCRPHHQKFHENWRYVVHLEGRKQFDK